jgi:cytochrome c peroxidase
LKDNTPVDNPLSPEKIALGKKLFFDKRLSLDETVSCASCHVPELAFTDGLQKAKGVFGRTTDRNSPSILNALYLPKVMFDGEISTLEMQVIVPIQEHTEMGMVMKDLIQKLRAIPEYQQEAKLIFQRDFDPWVLTRSISAYERSLISLDSPFDRYYYHKQKSAITNDAKSGWKLFSEKLHCTKCHNLPLFTTHQVTSNGLVSEKDEDKGRFRIHVDTADIGKFKIPSLRNISLTAPYMHDGRFRTMDEVLVHYMKGGNKTINQDSIIQPFNLNHQQIKQLKAFFESLTEINLKTKYN